MGKKQIAILISFPFRVLYLSWMWRLCIRVCRVSIMVIHCLFQTTLLIKEKSLKTIARMSLEGLLECELSYTAYIWMGDYMVVASLIWLLSFLCC